MVDTILKTLGHISRLYVKKLHNSYSHSLTFSRQSRLQIERNKALNNCCLPPLSFIRHANGSEVTVVTQV